MFKRIALLVCLVSILLSTTAFSLEKKMDNSIVIDSSNISQGVIDITYNGNEDNKIKVLVEKETMRYYYDLRHNMTESFPLQMGNGDYKIYVLERVKDNKYKVIQKEKISVVMTNEQIPYLNSIQTMKWDKEDELIQKAEALTKEADNDEEKVRIIYEFMIKNVSYDFDKIDQLPQGYIPNPYQTLMDGKGICYDYASLFASILRSLEIPTKLIKGYKDDIVSYHAWNEVYLKSEDKWIVIDTTYDTQMEKNEKDYEMIKDSLAYKKTGEY